MKGTRTSPYASYGTRGHDRRVVSIRLSPTAIDAINEAADAAKVQPSEYIRAVLAEELGLQRWQM